MIVLNEALQVHPALDTSSKVLGEVATLNGLNAHSLKVVTETLQLSITCVCVYNGEIAALANQCVYVCIAEGIYSLSSSARCASPRVHANIDAVTEGRR